MFLDYSGTLVAEEAGPRAEVANLRKAQLSKLKSLTNQLQNLLQKKIRIDLEIRNTKKKLSRLKSSSSTTFKTSLSLEGFDLSAGKPSVLDLAGSLEPELLSEFTEFDRVLSEAANILSSIEDLPLSN